MKIAADTSPEPAATDCGDCSTTVWLRYALALLWNLRRSLFLPTYVPSSPDDLILRVPWHWSDKSALRDTLLPKSPLRKIKLSRGRPQRRSSLLVQIAYERFHQAYVLKPLFVFAFTYRLLIQLLPSNPRVCHIKKRIDYNKIPVCLQRRQNSSEVLPA